MRFATALVIVFIMAFVASFCTSGHAAVPPVSTVPPAPTGPGPTGTGPAEKDTPTGTSAPTPPEETMPDDEMTMLDGIEILGFELEGSYTGKIEPGRLCTLDVEVTAEDDLPAAVRAWIGTESADGSLRSLGTRLEEGVWQVKVEVPKPIPEGSQFWVEIQLKDRTRLKGAFDLEEE